MASGSHAIIPDRYFKQSHFFERTPEEYSRRLRELTTMLATGPGGPAQRYWDIIDLLDDWEVADRDWVKVLKLQAVQGTQVTASSCEPTAAAPAGWISVAEKIPTIAAVQSLPLGGPTAATIDKASTAGAVSDQLKNDLIARNKEVALRRRAEKEELDQRSRAHRLLQQLGRPY